MMRTVLDQRNNDKGELLKFWAVTFTKFSNYRNFLTKLKGSLEQPIYFNLNWLRRSTEYSKALTYTLSQTGYLGLMSSVTFR